MNKQNQKDLLDLEKLTNRIGFNNVLVLMIEVAKLKQYDAPIYSDLFKKMENIVNDAVKKISRL